MFNSWYTKEYRIHLTEEERSFILRSVYLSIHCQLISTLIKIYLAIPF